MHSNKTSIRIRPLELSDAQLIASSLATAGINKPVSQYIRYAGEQAAGERVVLVAFIDEGLAGYVALVWRPDYPPFATAGIPEIQDLNVLPDVRRRGVATALLDRAEAVAAARSGVVGIGVGIGPDYGPAQRLYVVRGYVPDALGAVYANEPVTYGQRVAVDDDLTLHLTKTVAHVTPPN